MVTLDMSTSPKGLALARRSNKSLFRVISAENFCSMFGRWGKHEMPTDIAVDSLRDDQMSDLNRLRGWLYRKRIQVRLDRERAERRQKREETKRKAGVQALFDF